jgi:truncated hemoglobin YjbI
MDTARLDGPISRPTLDALVPRPPGVVNQRNDPFFDRYAISGTTYVTASGAVIPNELQYYNGEMVHFYGECANASAVNEVVAGSGYRPVTLRYADGRQCAAVQLWANRFTDTSIGPYSAMFMVVIVVPDDVPSERTVLHADPNGATSVLVMLDGSFDTEPARYENRARLFMVRLIDTTQVAIDVGRERMGTDKRPGTVDVVRSGRHLRVSISDQHGRGVVRAGVELTDDPAAYMPAVAKAAATAGIELRALPRGTEFIYTAVARIERRELVSWQWRSDVPPQLQPVVPGTVVIDPSSEEGRMLLTWGFTPKVLGYIGNVRGVVTGLADPTPRRSYVGATVPREGVPGGYLTTENVPMLRVAPGGSSGVPGQVPVLRLTSAEPSRMATTVTNQPVWAWDTSFLGSLKVGLRREVVGVTPDGLRIEWHVTRGNFVGPELDWVVLPGGADWTRIRQDGVGVVNVQLCFETRTGERIHCSYSGLFDLGVDGYARALRGDSDPFPPVVVTPTFATAAPALTWLNRTQCVGVGRVDMKAQRIEYDFYVVRVGDRAKAPRHVDWPTKIPVSPASLYTRLGGHDVIVAVTDDFVDGALADPQLGRFFPDVNAQSGLQELKTRVAGLLCEISGGPCVYKGRDMKTAHKGLSINEADWKIAIELFTAALAEHNVPIQTRTEFVQIIERMKGDIVEVPGGSLLLRPFGQ